MTARKGISVILALWFAGALAAQAGPPSSPDLAALLDGVAEIAAPGVPGSLCVFGEQAFPVVTGKAGKFQEPVVAAARLGAGRVVAFGHDGYLNADALAAAGTGRLMLNAVRWAGGGRVAVHRLPGLLKFLQGQGIQAESLDEPMSAERLKPFGLLCCQPSKLTSESVSAVAEFVNAGGGLVSAETGWGWLQLHPGQNLGQNHGNVLLAPAGIVWTDGTLERTSAAGFRVGGPPSPLCHAARALDALKSPQNADETALAVWTVSRAVRALPADDALLRPRLRELIEGQQEAIPTKQTPVTMKAPLARLALTLQMEEMKRLPLDKVQAHPAAAAFPGSVPADAQKVSRSVECDATVPGWHSTGLYAPPGQVITVEIPAAAAKGELQLRLGAHSDRLWDKDSWWRCPEVTASFPLDKPLVQAASAFGGLIYVDVPKGSKLGTAAVTIRDAVEAPHFVLGKTTLADWREKIRQRPAPWAELESSKVILTVPSTALRGLDDPEELMKFWDKVLDACAELAGLPLERERPERYVADVQISAGYMHSGYPIMTHLDAAAVMVDKPRMIREGAWGLFHEMGHNHQSPDWTFAGTGEVTCNLFTLYVLDTVCHTANRHPALSAASRAKKLGEHFAAGAKFEKWRGDPFLALIMYVQLQEAFGWDSFKRVFAEYRGLAKEQRPKTDDEKRDQWLVRLSRTVGRNLGPFFQAWGVPTSDKARASVADLPAWMPEGLAPK